MGFGYPSVAEATAFPSWAAAAARSAAKCALWTIAAAGAPTSAAGAILGTAEATRPAHGSEGRP